jgi:hypothetical protein
LTSTDGINCSFINIAPSSDEPHHREHVRDLGVTGAGDFTHIDLDVPIGKRRRYTLRNGQRRIVGTRDAENQLKNGVILQGKCAQVLFEIAFQAVQRHEQADRWHLAGATSLRFASEARNTYNCDGRITDRCDRGDIKGRREETYERHVALFASRRRLPCFYIQGVPR